MKNRVKLGPAVIRPHSFACFSVHEPGEENWDLMMGDVSVGCESGVFVCIAACVSWSLSLHPFSAFLGCARDESLVTLPQNATCNHGS